MKTIYLSGYDVESERCIKGVEAIVKQHKARKAPATFFVVGELLENREWAAHLHELTEGELFDIQSHTYSHIALKAYEDKPVDYAKVVWEIDKTNELIFELWGKKVVGLRTPSGFESGILGENKLQGIIWKNGIRFVSSRLMGRGNTVPSGIYRPFYYEEDDILRPLLELPAHDWHDNVLKGYNSYPVGWPPNLPWGYPDSPPVTPEEEFAIYKKGVDYFFDNQMIYYSPIMHPWSIYRFNKEAKTIGLILDYVAAKGMEICHFRQMYQSIDEEHISLNL